MEFPLAMFLSVVVICLTVVFCISVARWFL